jgi:hypothetical protein
MSDLARRKIFYREWEEAILAGLKLIFRNQTWNTGDDHEKTHSSTATFSLQWNSLFFLRDPKFHHHIQALEPIMG